MSAHDPAETRVRKRSGCLWRGLRAVLLAYLVALLLLMIFEERFIFIPVPFDGSADWQADGIARQDIFFSSADGTKLHGWYFPHESPRAVVLFSHGNYGNITHRLDLAQRLHHLGVATFLFDYRGYGRSEGQPKEKGVLADARAARTRLAELAGVDESEIVLMGRSLGGGVAVDLAAHDGARGLILQSTFTSIPDVAAIHYPFFPVRTLMRTQFDSLHKIADYQGPILQSHGNRDRTIPYEQGVQLFAAAGTSEGVPREFFTIEGGDHNDPQPRTYYERLDWFLDQLP